MGSGKVAVGGAGVVVALVNELHGMRCCDCGVACARQYRQTELMQPTPPLAHDASRAVKIPTDLSPTESMVSHSEGGSDAGVGKELGGDGAVVREAGAVVVVAGQLIRWSDDGVLRRLQNRHTVPRQPSPPL
jgi:hypothetical protein